MEAREGVGGAGGTKVMTSTKRKQEQRGAKNKAIRREQAQHEKTYRKIKQQQINYCAWLVQWVNAGLSLSEHRQK